MPEAMDDDAATDTNTAVDINVLLNDTDVDTGDTLTVISTTNGSNGATVTINPDGTVKYTPASGFTGTDTFTYTISDGNGGESTATVTVYVGVNAPPVAEDDAYNTDEDTTLNVPAPGVMDNDSDIDGTITAAIVTNGSNGTATLNADGSFSYVPNPNYHGTDSFTYEITDNIGTTATATVTITINSVDETPTAGDDAATTLEDTEVTINFATNDSNPDGGTIITFDATSARGGTIVNNGNGTFAYTPPAGYTGEDTFTYTVTDGDGDFNTATVTVTVQSSNQTPTAADDSAITEEGTAVTFDYASNDSNPDGGGGISVDATSANGGTVQDNDDGTFTYTPRAGFYGTDTFSYTLTDGDGDSDTATVTVKVRHIEVTPKTSTIEVGDTVDLDETLLPADATHPAVVWSSSDTSVATVDANGVVTGVTVGRVIITATSGGISDTSIVEVQSTEVIPPEATLIRVEGDIFYTTDETPIPGIEMSLYSVPQRGTSNNQGYFYLGYTNEGTHTLTAESSPGTEIGRIVPITFTRGATESYVIHGSGAVEVTFTDATRAIYLRLEIPRSTGIIGVRDVIFTTTAVDNPETGEELNGIQKAFVWLAGLFAKAK